MLQRVAIEGIKFPRLYIAENNRDVAIARENGIPYVRWKWGQEQLVKQLLRPVIEKMFPGIKWDLVLGEKKPVRSQVIQVSGSIIEEDNAGVADYDAQAMLDRQHEFDEIVDTIDHETQLPNEDGEYTRIVDIAEDERQFSTDNSGDGFHIERMSIQQYIGDLAAQVDIDALQKLGMLPQFVGDVTDCIKRNLSQSMRWTEGYNKKLGYPLGKFNCKAELQNLVIIDVSGSIPDGISATMITLADTLRSQCNADLIITGSRSGFYPSGCELPKPQTIRDYYGKGNESAEFAAILKKHIAGREFGYVISFGDDDSPCWKTNEKFFEDYDIDMKNTIVHCVHHYHTNKRDTHTGYAGWVDVCSPYADKVYDTSWCNIMKTGGRW